MFKDKDNYVKIVNLIKEKNGELTKSEIINDYSLSSYSLNKLIENGYLLTEDRVVYRYNTRSYIEESKNVLNDEQKNAFNKILNSDKKGFLLKGVTGSDVYKRQVKDALIDVKETGYGLVAPQLSEMKFEEPEIVKQGNKFGVKLKASAPSLHLIKADIKTEISPIMGSEKESEELVKAILDQFESDPTSLWQSNMFGKSLDCLLYTSI